MPLRTKKQPSHIGITRQLGFTLVEMVTVIIVLGILVVGVSSFVIFGTRIFIESASVDQVLSQSRFGVERMTRDIRNAVPNSIRVQTATNGTYQCIEILPISASTSYLDAPIYPDPVDDTMAVIQSNETITAGWQAIMYPLTESELYSAAGTEGKRFEIDSVSVAANQADIKFASDVRFLDASPLKRVFFAQEPMSYCFVKPNSTADADLFLYQGYGFQASQPVPSDMGMGVLMAQNVSNAFLVEPAIVLTPSSLVTNAIVHLQPRFSVNGESFKYQHQVQVMNVP
ncbi:PilW family protein [Shewanella maritima]|uniref:PilW family protein n=1 Tax=Shewanella maritima TaxID=2520507 RepID=UPI003734F5AB